MPLDQPDENDPVSESDYDYGDPTGGGYSLAPHDKTMPLGDHIEELRSRIMRMLIGVGLALVITAVFGFQIIGWLAQPLLHVQSMLGVPAQRSSRHGLGRQPGKDREGKQAAGDGGTTKHSNGFSSFAGIARSEVARRALCGRSPARQ